MACPHPGRHRRGHAQHLHLRGAEFEDRKAASDRLDFPFALLPSFLEKKKGGEGGRGGVLSWNSGSERKMFK